MMEQELSHGSPLLVYVHDILEGVSSIEGIVSRMLEFAAPARPAPQNFSLEQAVLEVLRGYQLPAQENAVQISTDFPPEMPPAYADPHQTRSLMSHLIRNAIQCMPNGGDLRICGSRSPGPVVGTDQKACAELKISDNGPGIPNEFIDRVFDPFFTTARKKEGLGLSVVFRLCELNHIRLFLDSTKIEGTTFSLLFQPALALADGQGHGNVGVPD